MDYSSFDLLTGGQEIKLAILVKFLLFYFVCLVHIALLLLLLPVDSFNFNIMK